MEKNVKVGEDYSRRASAVHDLFEAIHNNDDDKFFQVLNANADVRGEWLERRNDEQESLLFCASKRGLHRVVAKLVELDVSLESRDCYNVTPLHAAARFGHFK